MSVVTVQIPGIVLPRIAPLGFESEWINDLVTHVSLEFPVDSLQEKMIEIVAVEAIAMGVPGNLQAWIELSPYPSVNSPMWAIPLPVATNYWAAIGGGGGALPPVAPTVIVAAGVPLQAHTFMLAWNDHSAWARLVMQTPIAAGLPTAFWIVQAMFSGKS